MSMEDYQKALRLGQKQYRACVARGDYPYLQVLDDILENVQVQSEYSLGLVNIPTEKIVGTCTAGRTTAFASNFMPLLADNTEFASKWANLCRIHLDEGIRDPIVVSEFMNYFYVQEGNKRVSVLKYFGAESIPAIVTRILPRPNGTLESQIYYEFLSFYQDSQVNYLWFSRKGSFQKLQNLLGTCPGRSWTDEERRELSSAYYRFSDSFDELGGHSLPITTGDAMLVYLGVYGYDHLRHALREEITSDLERIWKEVLALTRDEAVDLVMEPSEPAPTLSLRSLFLPASSRKLKIAFLHDKSAQTSGWTYNHEMGRKHLESTFPGQIETIMSDNLDSPAQVQQALDQAVEQGCQMIFTTSPVLLPQSLKTAVEHPEVKVLNCSLNTPHPTIRTYYGRMYEAKFLLGAIAGALAENDRVGYLADYPIYGMAASINAFALGAQMTNPRAKVYLEWSTIPGHDVEEAFRQNQVRVISNQDRIRPIQPSRQFGLYHLLEDGTLENLAMPVWNWGIFYERIVRNVILGGWKSDSPEDPSRAVNYWWGMDAKVIDLFYSRSLPASTLRLVELLKSSICRHQFHPFSGRLASQQGVVQEDGAPTLSPSSIITMDWLAENVVGSFPSLDDLSEEARTLVGFQGILQEGGSV